VSGRDARLEEHGHRPVPEEYRAVPAHHIPTGNGGTRMAGAAVRSPLITELPDGIDITNHDASAAGLPARGAAGAASCVHRVRMAE
jgi:hypothetical protein